MSVRFQPVVGSMSSPVIYETVKRACDLLVAGAGLTLVSPLIGVVGFAVVLDSPGRAFYRSRRVGRNGRQFDLIKLRTMTTAQGISAPQVTAASDCRITRVGRWLRRTKIDELPQLWNVFVGDISLVGPRPEVQRYVERYPQEYREILQTRPGLTDRATLQFLDEESLLASQQDPERYYIEEVMPKKIKLYLEYVSRPSLREDASILAHTALRVAGRLWRGRRSNKR